MTTECELKEDQTEQDSGEQLTISHHKRRKKGPYSKAQRESRRQEVFRLHFILGYSMAEIAKLMNVNYKTIEKDVAELNTRLAQQWGKTNLRAFMQKQVSRLEAQRSRLMAMLDKAENPELRLRIEQLILEIDTRLSQLITRMFSTRERLVEVASRMMNKESEKRGWNVRWISWQTLSDLPKDKYEQVIRIIGDPCRWNPS